MKQKYGRVFHLGIVVEDMHRAVEIFEKEMGIGPWQIDEHADFFHDKKVNDGIGMDFAAATFRSKFGYEIEVIEPVGPSVYMDFLKEHGPGIHHVMLETTDNYKETLAMADRVSGGRPPVLSTYFQDGTPICFYADMLKEIGLVLECGAEPGASDEEE